MIFKDLKLIVATTLLLVILAGCNTLPVSRDWPHDLPDRQFFVDEFLKKRNLTKPEPQVVDAHLIWIKRFYQGTILYPNGWSKASKQFLDTVDNQNTKKDLQRRMRKLGILIACEWAQDNDVRNIDSSNMAVWASAMREAASLRDQSNFVTQVEKDVAQLISGEMNNSEIAFERYYPDDDYDNF